MSVKIWFLSLKASFERFSGISSLPFCKIRWIEQVSSKYPDDNMELRDEDLAI